MVFRSRSQRLALADGLTKQLSLLTDSDDIVLNSVAMNHGGQSDTWPLADSLHKEAEGPVQKLIVKSKPNQWNLGFVFNFKLSTVLKNPQILQNKGLLLQNR